ncbi:MAG TPA: hypothetical protein VF272_01390 [Candidatus Saccharimonadia bacterium]
MLNASTAESRGSIIFELLGGILLIGAVSLGVYELQHPELTQQQQIQAALEH